MNYVYEYCEQTGKHCVGFEGIIIEEYSTKEDALKAIKEIEEMESEEMSKND